MFFYTYFDPESINVAEKHKINSSLINLLRNWVANCIIFTFQDDHLRQTISDNINKVTDPGDQKRIKSLFILLEKRNRFIYEILPDYEGRKTDIQCLAEQIDKLYIDFLLLETETLDDSSINKKIQYSSITKYEHSNFEEMRSKIACFGMDFFGNEFDYKNFYERIFHKAMATANSVQIWDRLIGAWGDNFKYNLRKFIYWLETITAMQETLQIEVHCEKPEGRLDETIISELESLLKGNIRNIHITFYEKRKLPHQRFIVTDQIALDIGRGIDLIDPKTKKNRDTSISLKDLLDLKKLLLKYSDFKISSYKISN